MPLGRWVCYMGDEAKSKTKYETTGCGDSWAPLEGIVSPAPAHHRQAGMQASSCQIFPHFKRSQKSGLLHEICQILNFDNQFKECLSYMTQTKHTYRPRLVCSSLVCTLWRECSRKEYWKKCSKHQFLWPLPTCVRKSLGTSIQAHSNPLLLGTPSMLEEGEDRS